MQAAAIFPFCLDQNLRILKQSAENTDESVGALIMRFILPSVTTHGLTAHTWRNKIDEIAPLELSHIGLFLTGLGLEQRRECYWRLLNVRRKHAFEIPFVHAVSDMSEQEYTFLIDRFQTKVFNLHPLREFPLQKNLSAGLRKLIAIENSAFQDPLLPEDLAGFGGICLDVSHLEESRIASRLTFSLVSRLCESGTILGNHISAAHREGVNFRGKQVFSFHVARSMEDFEYLRNYPARYFSNYCALELENPLAEQKVFASQITEIIERNEAEDLKEAA